ncbi:hypothetical protein N7535_006523 [Penicillium sp. DV-2018c]|nr:hypothetical protein N7461_007394 [Penicillium sp. DV-2018c]KAJ5567217.1 hypothetical protein N7535_006523 [Penicillium sp. DV-2018c]
MDPMNLEFTTCQARRDYLKTPDLKGIADSTGRKRYMGSETVDGRSFWSLTQKADCLCETG